MQIRKVMTSYVVLLKQYTQLRIFPEILEQCSSNVAREMYIPREGYIKHTAVTNMTKQRMS